VVLNVDMMGNVFNTRFDEASVLFHPSMLAWVGVAVALFFVTPRERAGA